jgi:hypothetical protein
MDQVFRPIQVYGGGSSVFGQLLQLRRPQLPAHFHPWLRLGSHAKKHCESSPMTIFERSMVTASRDPKL